MIQNVQAEEENRKAKKDGAYTAQQLAEDLKSELQKGHDPVRIGRWASGIYAEHGSTFDREISAITKTLMAMEKGPEFYLTEGSIRHIINHLIKASERISSNGRPKATLFGDTEED